MNYKILLVDDHTMHLIALRGQLVSLGYHEKDIKSARNCNQLLQELKQNKNHQYTHLILDIGLTDGSTLEVIPDIRNLYGDLPIMIFSAKSPKLYASALNEYNITHCLCKEADEEETLRGLTMFLNNVELPQLERERNPFEKLTPREFDTLLHVISGKGSNEIGALLNMAQNTVSTFKRRIFEKTGTNNTAELIELARVFGYL